MCMKYGLLRNRFIPLRMKYGLLRCFAAPAILTPLRTPAVTSSPLRARVVLPDKLIASHLQASASISFQAYFILVSSYFLE